MILDPFWYFPMCSVFVRMHFFLFCLNVFSKNTRTKSQHSVSGLLGLPYITGSLWEVEIGLTSLLDLQNRNALWNEGQLQNTFVSFQLFSLTSNFLWPIRAGFMTYKLYIFEYGNVSEVRMLLTIIIDSTFCFLMMYKITVGFLQFMVFCVSGDP